MFEPKVFSRIVKNGFYLSKEHLRENLSVSLIFVPHTLNETISDFGQTASGRLAKTAFNLSGCTLLGNKFHEIFTIPLRSEIE